MGTTSWPACRRHSAGPECPCPCHGEHGTKKLCRSQALATVTIRTACEKIGGSGGNGQRFDEMRRGPQHAYKNHRGQECHYYGIAWLPAQTTKRHSGMSTAAWSIRHAAGEYAVRWTYCRSSSGYQPERVQNLPLSLTGGVAGEAGLPWDTLRKGYDGDFSDKTSDLELL